MYSELFKKDNNSILKYLQKLGETEENLFRASPGHWPAFPRNRELHLCDGKGNRYHPH